MVESVDRLYGHYVAAVKVRVDSELHASAALILGACPSITIEQFLEHARVAYEESKSAIVMQASPGPPGGQDEPGGATGSAAPAPVPVTDKSAEGGER